MHDMRAIREDPQGFDAGLARRGAEPVAARIVELDERRRAVMTQVQEAQARRNEASKAIGAAMGKGDTATAEALKAEVAALKDTLPGLEDEERALGAELDALLAALPNIPSDEVPAGTDEAGNVEVARWGQQRNFAFDAKEHADLDPPLLVRDEAVYGTGQLPKFADDLFRTTDGRWLIPTAEVSLTNSVREQILDDLAQPIRLTALTPCFRSEAGAAGKDTRGFIRQHQFEKVELVTVCKAEDWQAEHEHMVRSAELVLEALDLPYRRMLLCAGDMGATAKKTFDLEVWLPGQGAYREISSISWCGDYQARRMNARYRPAKDSGGGEKGTQFVHTLNGSGLAVG